jgi:8-oxo-dGTP pyrophosphatase MutT (NUDIX family)
VFRVRLAAVGYRAALLLLRAWWVVRRPKSRGVRCIVRSGEAVLLVRHTYGDRRWMLPGGRVRRGESPAETARREMATELALPCSEWREIGCLHARPGYRRRSRDEGFRRHTTHYVEAHAVTRAVALRPAELSAAEWYPPDALPEDRSDSLDLIDAMGWLGGRPREGPERLPRGPVH